LALSFLTAGALGPVAARTLTSAVTRAFSSALATVFATRLAAAHTAVSTTSSIATCLPLLETCCKCRNSNAMGGSQVADIGCAQLASLVQSDRFSGGRSQKTEEDGGGNSGEAHIWFGNVADGVVVESKDSPAEECLRCKQEKVAD
jgi:hypothetical protein